MNVREKLFFLLLILVWNIHVGFAQEQIQMNHINTKGNEVRALYRDVNGIIWLGTPSGLFSLPQLESRNPNSYCRPFTDVNKSISMLSGDDKGRLWVKNNANDVFLYDPRQNVFIEDTEGMLAEKGIKVRKEFTAFANENGQHWVIKGPQLFWYEGKTEKMTRIVLKTEYGVVAFDHNEKWLALLTEKELFLVSCENKKIVRTVPLPDDFKGAHNITMTKDHHICVWLRNSMLLYEVDSDKWSGRKTLTSSITGIVQDGRRQLWVSTRANGIYIYDAEGKQTDHLQHAVWDTNSLQSNQVNLLYYEPKSQTVWIAYRKGGLSVCSCKEGNLMLNGIADHQRQESVTDVLTFANAHDGRGMLMGLEKRGVYLHTSGTDVNVIDGGFATSLLSDSDGSIWVGFYQKGLLHRKTDGRETLYFKGESPYSIVKDNDGHVFVALLGKGVWRVDCKTGETQNTNLGRNFAFDLKYVRRELYAATTEGVFVTDNGMRWKKVFDGTFRSICFDDAGFAWLLGNEGREGLTVLNPDGKAIEVPAELKTASLKSISIDDNGNAWIVSPAELFMLSHDTKNAEKLVLYSFNIHPDGFQVIYNERASKIDADGILWLGTTKGYQRINTRQLISQMQGGANLKRLIIGAISINDNVLSPDCPFNDRVVLEEDVVFTRELNLNYDENNLVIECSQPYDNNFTTDTYYYQLKGLSDVWHPMEGMTVILSNLPPGEYELMTRTQSSGQHLLLAIRISPPWWRTWWAYLCYFLIVAAIACVVLRYYKNKRVYQTKLRELQLEQEQGLRMNELKLRFFTNISHDLRTPLSLIISPVEELMSTIKDPGANSTLQIVHRNAKQLLSLVNQILDFRRLEFGREKLLLSYGDIVTMLKDVCASFHLKAEKEHIDFSFVSTVERVETMFDRDKTTKIMMNLLSNAFKFTPPEGCITTSLDISDGHIIISVKDTGTGIPDEDKAHIFDRFYQSNTNNRNMMGSGIGLHIAREYVRLQGGDISVSDNEEGPGTTFRFTIPLRKQNVPLVSAVDVSSEKSVDSTPKEENDEAKHETTVLIVDDNQDLLTYMRQCLSTDYHILTAVDGMEAMTQLQQHDIDIIVSDVMMPGIDGLELCRRVKNDIETSHISVVLLTAKAMSSDELMGLEAGADDYITKPFSMDILRKRVHNLVERSRKQHERFAKEVEIEPSEITITSIDEQFIARAISIVESHIGEADFSVEQLSAEMGVHRAQLYKKLQHLTGKTPQQFVRILRLKRGKQLLEQSGLYVSEVAYKVGFNSPRIFSKYFKEEFGVTPKDYSKS